MTNNTTQIRAAVVRQKGGPFSIETLRSSPPACATQIWLHVTRSTPYRIQSCLATKAQESSKA